MSRTTRQYPYRWWSNETEIQQLNDDLEYWKAKPYYFQYVKKTKEEYDRDVAKAQADYEARVESNGGEIEYTYSVFWDPTPRIGYIRPFHVSKKKRIKLPVTYEETVAESKAKYTKRFRDGHSNETGQKTGFKKQAAAYVRKRNKAFCKKIVKGDIWEDDPYPTTKEAKQFVWNWW